MNLVSNFFFIILDNLATAGHVQEDFQLRQNCEEILKTVLQTSRDGATNNLDRTLQSEITTFFHQKFYGHNAMSMFDILSILAKYDPKLIRNLQPFIEEIVIKVDSEGSRNGRLMILLNQLFNKIKKDWIFLSKSSVILHNFFDFVAQN